MVSISGCAPRDGKGFLAQTRCAQLGDTTLASGSELLTVVNHIRARLGLPDFVGSWEFARDALYLGMCLDLMTTDAIAFIERYEQALVLSIDENLNNIKALSISIDPTVAPVDAPSDAFEALMEDDEPLGIDIILSMLIGAALLSILFALPYTLPRVEKVNERKRLLAIMKDRAFTPREHGESGEHTFMNLGRPVGCLWEHATRAAVLAAFAMAFLIWSDMPPPNQMSFSFVALFIPCWLWDMPRWNTSVDLIGSSPTIAWFRALLSSFREKTSMRTV